ncbi:hypothetical protein BH762_gp031 [Gordonia phage OneUp]|uniref:Uncharacterized protein n=1 Tax=Gordonia phage OneUp TaxID=1838074 RepID=A0A166Y9L7_9CAUD|nr:hypothetical protein BH762_gp031 [Gordonia phage OneUp]ANA86487.1 hypothetical protein PBI_ONEUP_154 [Gordonia phage OneUp]
MTRKRYRVIFADGMICLVDAHGIQDAITQVYQQDDDGTQNEIAAVIAVCDAKGHNVVARSIVDTVNLNLPNVLPANFN